VHRAGQQPQQRFRIEALLIKTAVRAQLDNLIVIQAAHLHQRGVFSRAERRAAYPDYIQT